MKLLVLNPNTTASMTDRVVAEVRRLAPAAWDVRGVTARVGCEVIASRAAFVTGAWAALETLRAQDEWADAVLLACFGDPGLAALREVSAVPVIGMAEAALHEALALGRPFHIVTAGAAWDGMLRELVRIVGADALLDGITVLDSTGLAMAREPRRAEQLLQGVLTQLQQRGAPTCILGGAGFAGLAQALHYDGVLTDGLSAAVRALGSRAALHEKPSP
jgi:Asp/Glu/hydantoin racemase